MQVQATGYKLWFENNVLHRKNDLPAIEHADGTKEWYIRGLRHRECGPAIERSNGTKEWWYNGDLHREGDLSAVEYPTGGNDGGNDGRLTKIYFDGSKEWY
jgi:hypothetical protein